MFNIRSVDLNRLPVFEAALIVDHEPALSV